VEKLHRLMSRLLPALALIALPSCEQESRRVVFASSKPIVGPDGFRHWWLECRESIGRCYAIAGRQCPNGYEVIERDGQRGAVATTDGTAFAPNSRISMAHGDATVSPTYHGTMIIKCKVPSARAPTSSASVPLPSSSASSGQLSRDMPY